MCCSDTPPPPDYSGIAAANSESARYAKQAADNELAFRKQVYADSQPATQKALDTATKVAQSQLQDAEIARERGMKSWGDWEKYGRDQLLPSVVGDAMQYGGSADQAQQAGRAVSDVRNQSAIARAAGMRSMAGAGVNPNSGRFAAMNRSMDLNESAMAAGAATNARMAARDKGIGLRSGALAGLQGQQNVAGQNMGLGLSAGTQATGNMNAGANNGLGWANFGAGGTGSAISAANLGVQSNLGTGNLMSSNYQQQMSAHNAEQAALGQAVGTAIGFAAGRK